jgi:hypothetical protein
MDSPGDILYQDTMRRLQKMEELSVSFAAHTATEEMRFSQISQQIEHLGEKMEIAMNGLAVQVNRHTEQLNNILSTHNREELNAETKRKVGSIAWGVLILAVGGFLAKMGETLWEYLSKR